MLAKNGIGVTRTNASTPGGARGASHDFTHTHAVRALHAPSG
jgi:hypothetical protein